MEGIDRFVAPSEFMAEEYRRLGIAPERITVADYGFARSSLGTRLQVDAFGPLRVGYLGSLVWHKGVHVLVDAVRQLASAEVKLLLHGDPALDPEYVADLRARSAGAPVEFRGPFDPFSWDLVCLDLDVVVVPSLWLENSPLVIHEALMSGVPVIGSDIGGIPGLIRHEENGLLVEPGSVDALAAAIRRLATDRRLLDRLRLEPHRVRSIQDDAADWERRYDAVMAAG
jgi:glycosyltransferase involved in cell wall biosynthesis